MSISVNMGEYMYMLTAVYNFVAIQTPKYRFANSLRASSQHNCMTYTIAVCVQWKTPDDGQRNCPKHVEFYSKNKFEKLVHLVGFIKRKRQK